MLRGQGMEYTVLGDAVNLAARLMANAPANGILIDESTKRHGSHVVKDASCVCVCGRALVVVFHSVALLGCNAICAMQL